jgi:hypothetical protein
LKLQEIQVDRDLLLPADQNSGRAIEPRMGALDLPAQKAGFFARMKNPATLPNRGMLPRRTAAKHCFRVTLEPPRPRAALFGSL